MEEDVLLKRSAVQEAPVLLEALDPPARAGRPLNVHSKNVHPS